MVDNLYKLKMLYDLMEGLLEDLGVEIPDKDDEKREHLSKTKRIYAALDGAYNLGIEDIKQSIQEERQTLPKRTKYTQLGIKEIRAAVQAITSELRYDYETKSAGIERIAPEGYREHLLRVLDVLEIVAERGSGFIEVKSQK